MKLFLPVAGLVLTIAVGSVVAFLTALGPDNPPPPQEVSDVSPDTPSTMAPEEPEQEPPPAPEQNEQESEPEEQETTPPEKPVSPAPQPVAPVPPQSSEEESDSDNDSEDNSEGDSSPASVPGVPQSLAVTAERGQAALSWSAPTSDGGAAVSDYVVEQSTDDSNWTVFVDGVSTSTSATVTSLTNGTTYYFRVKATNSVGTGEATASVNSDLIVVPAAPTGLSITESSRSEASLSWSAPADDGGASISDYVIQQSTDGTSWTTVNDGTSASTTATVSSLVGGETYYFQVAAVNSAGTGTYVSDNITWVVTPTAPTSFSVTASPGQASLSWSAPFDDGGAGISDYVIQQSTDGTSWSTLNDGVSTLTSATVTSLTNGSTYYFRVAAVNSEGTGAYTSAKSVTIPSS